jgi:hypothetical protein
VSGDLHPALARVLREDGCAELLSILSERVAGADLSTLLLEVARRRAGRLTPRDVLAQYERDRFVAPATVGAARLRELERLAYDAITPLFEPIVLSPVVPFGTHSVLGGVDQNNVVTTMRTTEVAADPTSSLALEAAVRRRRQLSVDARSAEVVRLGTVDRALRAQQVEGPRSFPHFSLLGLVTAGRDRGNRTFERLALVEHVETLAAVARLAGASQVVVRLTDFGGAHGEVIERARAELTSEWVSCELWPGRTAAVGYYPTVCFKLDVVIDGEVIELGDGGIVNWTQLLLQNQKERLMISGLGLERLAAVVGGP